jgi:hypothetical protein
LTSPCSYEHVTPWPFCAKSWQLRVQIGYQWDKDGGLQLDKAPIAHQGGKLPTPMALHVFSVIRFERAIVGLMEPDDDGHDLAVIHLGWAQALSLTRCEQLMVPVRGKVPPKIVYGTKQFE